MLSGVLDELGRVPREEEEAREAVAGLIERNTLIQKMTAVKERAGEQSKSSRGSAGLLALESMLGRIAALDHSGELSGLESLIRSIEGKHLEFLRAVGEAQGEYTKGFFLGLRSLIDSCRL